MKRKIVKVLTWSVLGFMMAVVFVGICIAEAGEKIISLIDDTPAGAP